MLIFIKKKYNFSDNRQKIYNKYKLRKWNSMCQIYCKEIEAVMNIMRMSIKIILKIIIQTVDNKEKNNFL